MRNDGIEILIDQRLEARAIAVSWDSLGLCSGRRDGQARDNEQRPEAASVPQSLGVSLLFKPGYMTAVVRRGTSVSGEWLS